MRLTLLGSAAQEEMMPANLPSNLARTHPLSRTVLLSSTLSLAIMTGCERYALVPVTVRSELRSCIRIGCVPFQRYGDLGSPRIYLVPGDGAMREHLRSRGVSVEEFAASEAGRDFVRRHTFVGEDVVSGDYVNLNGRSRSFTCLTEPGTRNYRCQVDGFPIHFGFPPIDVTGGELVTFDGVLVD